MGLNLHNRIGFCSPSCRSYEYGYVAFNYKALHLWLGTFFMETGFYGAHAEVIETIFLMGA